MDFIDIESAEEATRQWWQRQYGTPLPEEVKGWLKLMSRREVQKARVAEHFLDDVTLHKTQDNRRLCQTKLANVEASIAGIRQQMDRLRRFIRLNAELKVHQANLYEINKRAASVLTERKELERFETFEAVNGQYQRILGMERQLLLLRQMTGKNAVSIDDAQRLYDEAEKAMTLEQKKCEEMQDATLLAVRTTMECERICASRETLTQAQKSLNGITTLLEERLEMAKHALEENQSHLDAAISSQNELKGKRQSMEAHQGMIEHGENIQTLIDELTRARAQQTQLQARLKEATAQQNERNEQLAKLFTESQAIDAGTNALREEIEGHRRSIAGQDSYTLQKRAMDLRGRKLMLQTGLSLWKNIAEGYTQIDYKEQLITQMRGRIEQLNRNIDQLRTRVKQVQRQLDEKNYHWTVSKSQNVIELRNDLSEGYPCTVCGATHHPWHSETITEQNALIASMKADVEALRQELRTRNDELHALEMELTATEGQLRTETDNMRLLVERQKKDTDEWRIFSTLDRSFTDCSPSTNREARTAMIQQLIEKATIDAEDAQKTLDTFNFHLNAINQLGNQAQAKQQQANDLTVRLNEVNTACQVIVRQVEHTSKELTAATQEFSRRYTLLEKLITIPDWLRMWKESPEGLKLRIQGMMDQWAENEKNISEKAHEVEEFERTSKELQAMVTRTIADIAEHTAISDKADEHISKWNNSLEKLLNQGESKDIFSRQYDALLSQQNILEKSRENAYQQMRELMGLKAQMQICDENIQQINSQLANERLELDLWMGRYNANHPPVQITELERVLADGKDWNDLRQQVRDIVTEQAATQAKVDSIKAEIIELQAEGTKMDAENGHQEQERLQQQLETLETKRQEILRQIAHLEELLQAHETVKVLKE